jgi:hypothetical protein
MNKPVGGTQRPPVRSVLADAGCARRLRAQLASPRAAAACAGCACGAGAWRGWGGGLLLVVQRSVEQWLREVPSAEQRAQGLQGSECHLPLEPLEGQPGRRSQGQAAAALAGSTPAGTGGAGAAGAGESGARLGGSGGAT